MNGSPDDERLARKVAEAIDNYEPIEAAGYRIAVTAKDGVVRLDGIVRTEVHRFLAARIAGEKAGFVENKLTTDQLVETQVARAFAQDSALGRTRIIVKSYLGDLRLQGSLPKDLAERAVSLARSVANVREVVDELQLL